MRTKPAVAAELTWPQVHAFRLQRHHLLRRAPREELTQTVRDFGGAQAQVMSAAELQIATRVQCSVADVRRALWRDKTLVKTWLMRGTLHLIPAEDLPLYAAAMQTKSVKPGGAWFRYFGLTESDLSRIAETIGEVLNGQPMTREEIIAAAGEGHSERVREWLRSGWGGFLKPVARRGLLCFGPSRGTNVTFVRPAAWLGSEWRELDPDAALAEVARRYLAVYGPATPADFANWFGRWTGVGRAAWSALAGEIMPVSVEGTRADVLARDLPALTRLKARASVQLLPPFDPYLMGHDSRDHLFERVHAPKVSRTAGWISAVVLVDGRVVGTWTYAVADGTLRIELAPFGALSAATRAEVELRADALAHALGLRRAEVISPRRAPRRSRDG